MNEVAFFFLSCCFSSFVLHSLAPQHSHFWPAHFFFASTCIVNTRFPRAVPWGPGCKEEAGAPIMRAVTDLQRWTLCPDLLQVTVSLVSIIRPAAPPVRKQIMSRRPASATSVRQPLTCWWLLPCSSCLRGFGVPPPPQQWLTSSLASIDRG